LDRPGRSKDLDDLGLRLADAKPLLASIQMEIATHQIKEDAERQSSYLGSAWNSVGQGAKSSR
jgi:hypothetical protein